MSAIVTLLIVVFVGGGVSVAAQNSLPGDLLYPVKTEVNERIRAGLTFSVEAKAHYQAKLAARRLLEAEKLAAKAELSAEVRSKIEARLQENLNAAQDYVQKAKAKGQAAVAEAIQAKLEASLNASSTTLENLAAEGYAQAELVFPLIDQVRVRMDTLLDSSADMEMQKEAGGEADGSMEMRIEETEAGLEAESQTEGFVEVDGNAVGIEAEIEVEAGVDLN